MIDKNLKPQLIATLGDTVLQFCNDVGLRKIGNKHEKWQVIGYVIRFFKDLTVNDCKMAFDLAIVRDLDLQETDYNHYNNFHPAYFCKLLRAFKVKKPYLIDIGIIKVKKLKQLPDRTSLTHQEQLDLDNKYKKILYNAYQHFRETGSMAKIPYLPYAYDFMQKRGIIQFTGKRLKEFELLAGSKPTKKRESNQSHVSDIIGLVVGRTAKEMPQSGQISSKAKSIAITQLFSDWNDMNISISIVDIFNGKKAE